MPVFPTTSSLSKTGPVSATYAVAGGVSLDSSSSSSSSSLSSSSSSSQSSSSSSSQSSSSSSSQSSSSSSSTSSSSSSSSLGSGLQTPDSSGNDLHFTLVGLDGSNWVEEVVSGASGRSFIFNSSGARLTGAALSNFISASAGSMSLWCKPTGSSPVVSNVYDGFVLCGTSFAGLFRATISGQDRLWAYNWDGSEDRVGVAYSVDTWVHLVWVHAGGNLMLYANGVLAGTVASGNTQNVSGMINVGAFGSSTSFQGHIDEARFYDDEIVLDESLYLYNSHRGVSGGTDPGSANLTALYTFDVEPK